MYHRRNSRVNTPWGKPPLKTIPVGSNPETTPDMLATMLETNQPVKVRAAIASNPNLPEQLAVKFLSDPSPKVKKSLAVHTTYQNILEALTESTDPGILQAVAHNPATSEELLTRVYEQNKNVEIVVHALAKNHKLPLHYRREIFMTTNNPETLTQIVIQANKTFADFFASEEIGSLPVEKQYVIAQHTFVPAFIDMFLSSPDLTLAGTVALNKNISSNNWVQLACRLHEFPEDEQIKILKHFYSPSLVSYDFTSEQYEQVAASQPHPKLVSVMFTKTRVETIHNKIVFPLHIYKLLAVDAKLVLLSSRPWVFANPSILLVECFSTNRNVKSRARVTWGKYYGSWSLDNRATFMKFAPEELKELFSEGLPLEWITTTITDYYETRPENDPWELVDL